MNLTGRQLFFLGLEDGSAVLVCVFGEVGEGFWKQNLRCFCLFIVVLCSKCA